MKRLTLCFSSFLCLAGCYSSGIVCDFPPPPPLFSVQSVSNAFSNQPIGTVVLSSFTFNGNAVTVDEIFGSDSSAGAGYPANTEFRDGTILCETPCLFGFGVEEGVYSFDVAAEGYQTKRLEVNAKYKDLPPSRCGPGIDNLIELDIELNPSEPVTQVHRKSG